MNTVDWVIVCGFAGMCAMAGAGILAIMLLAAP